MRKSTKRKIAVCGTLLVGIGLFVWFGIFQKVGRFNTLQAVPVDAVFKVNIRSVNSVHERLRRNYIWQSLKSYPYFEEYHASLQYVDSLANSYPGMKRVVTDRPVTISCHQVALHDYDFLYVCDLGKLNVIRVFESVLLGLVEDEEVRIKRFKDPNGEIRELVWADLKFYFTIKDNLLIGSLSRALVSRSLARCAEDKEVEKAFISGDIVLDVDHGQLGRWLASVMEGTGFAKEVSLLRDTRLMLQLNDKNLRFTGDTRSNPEEFSMLDVANFLEGGTSSVKDIVGGNTAAYISFCFPSFAETGALLAENYRVSNPESFNEIKRYVDRVNKLLRLDVLEVFTSWIGGEVAIIKPRPASGQGTDDIVLAVQSKDIDLAKDQMAYLSEQIQRKTPVREREMNFNGYKIHYFKLKGFFDLFLGGIFNRFERPYYTFLGDYVVFSNSPETLTEMIKEYVLGNTLAHDEKHGRTMSSLGSKNNVFGYVQAPNMYEYLFGAFKSSSRVELEKNKGAFLSFETIGFSLSKSGGAFETQIVAKYNDKAPGEYEVRELSRQFENQVDRIEAGFYYAVIPDSIAIRSLQFYEYSTGETLFRGALRDGEPDGVWSVYRKSGALIGQFPYDAGKIDGMAPFFYENGEMLARVTYEKGQISYYQEFFPDGTKRAEIEYRKGVRHGAAKFYYNTGHLRCEGRYKKGQRAGKWRYYKVTGEKMLESEM